jgi:retron-type reverse transcriptase
MSSLDKLRQRISEIGRAGAILEEMIKMGFINDDDLRSHKVSRADVKKALEELHPIEKQILNLDEQTKAKSQRYENLIQEIRSERIEQVKFKREERKKRQALDREKRQAGWKERIKTEAIYLGEGVSSKLQFIGGDDSALASRSLPIVHSAKELADAMGCTVDDLVWLCYERNVGEVDHYSRFEIPKRSGGKRLISSPKPKMRQAQNWIQEKVLSGLQPSEFASAFRPDLSIVDNAKKHCDKKVIVKLDLKDFFPTITFPRVRGYFEFLGYNPGIASILALLCTDAPRVRVTFRGEAQIVATGPRGLPQGACTSPALANLIASRLDARLAGLATARSERWIYTRYADDLTLSTDSEVPEIGTFISAVSKVANDEKFQINIKKTRVMRAPHRQTVTGLLVGTEVRIPKVTIRRMRALFHRIEVQGKDIVSVELGKDALLVARGYLSYLHMVQPKLARKYRNKHSWLTE